MADRSPRILAIDDNRDNLTTLGAVVGDAFPGAVFLSALNGPRGLELAAAEDPDVIVLDIVMPDMDGFEVCRRLKADEQVRHIPVIFLTAIKTDRESRIKALDIGAEAFLSKPIDQEELTAQIRAMVKIKAAVQVQRQALRDIEDRYQRITETLTDYIYTVRIDRGVVTSTTHGPGCVGVTGYTETELNATPDLWAAMIAPEDRQRVVNHAETVTAGASTEPIEHRLVRKDGQIRWVRNTPVRHVDAQGQLIAYDGVLQDITARKQAEESMLRAQKLESIGVLAGGIAHDFNNLLGGLFGYLDMIREHLSEGQVEPALKTAAKAMGVFERAKSLTHQLLTFSKGGAPIRKTLQLGPIVQHSMQFALSGSNVAGECDVAANLWPCDCDENQIAQVVDNLVINAKQAMPMGGKIVATCENVCIEPARDVAPERCGNFVRVSVKDQGIGMPQEILPRIFDPFFSTKETGHGLGLATVFSIVQRHGGWIDVESEPGKGSTFRVFIPATAKAAAQASASCAPKHRGQGSILVMDDEAFMRDVVSDMLGTMGYRVVPANDGREALTLFAQAQKSSTPFVACILDLTIPNGMGGKETAPELRKLKPDAVIVAASGYSEDPVMARPADHGFTDRIVKPFRREDLSALLQRVLVG